MSSNRSRGQGRRVWALLVALAAVTAALAGPGAARPAAAGGVVKEVTCALPYVTGGPNLLCTGTHKILFTAKGFTNNNSTITADLVAFDEQGNALGSLRVHSGDLAVLTSNTSVNQLKLSSKKNTHTMTAPVPVLRVTADDGVDKVTAYCSIMPFARVFEPDGAVVSQSEGDVTHVLAAIPQVDPNHLVIKVDGVNVLAALGIGNPESCSAASPCSGNFNVGPNVVTVSDLVVDTAPINVLSTNTVSFDIAGLGCGGHLFVVNGTPLPGSVPKAQLARCHKDPISDKGLSSGFAINITSPTPLQTGVTFPVPVLGEVCSGRPIATVNVNGVNVPVAGQTEIPGNGSTTADTFKLAINVPLSPTDVAKDINTGDAAPGADPGSNLLIAAASDDEGNRTFTRFFYGTGNTLNTGTALGALTAPPAASSPLRNLGHHALQGLLERLHETLADRFAQKVLPSLSTSVDVNDAFVIGLTSAAIQQQFNKRCTDPVNGVGKIFRDKVRANLLTASPPNLVKVINVDPDCACGVDTGVWITGVDIDATDISCPVTFADNVIHAAINLPAVTIHLEVGFDGQGTGSFCEEDFLGVCVDRTDVHITGTETISGMNLKFDITEAQLLGGPAGTPVFDKGTATPLQNVNNFNTGVSCVGSDICEVGALVLDVISFGALNLGGIDVTVDPDFSQQVGASEPDPIKLHDIHIDEQKVASFNQTLEGVLTSVKIDANGLLAGLKGSFATDVVNPDIKTTPGALITHPPLPNLPVAGASDAFVALSTDTLNMLFAGMTVAGRLKEDCQPSGKTLGDLLPADCDTLINAASDIATALQQGVCHGIRLSNCEGLSASTDILTAIKQGACHGTRGDNCSNIPVPAGAVKAAAERTTCTNTPNLNLRADQNILFCTRQDIPPRMALLGGGGPDPVHTALRLKALSVALVLDRQGDGLDADLDATPQCFATGAPRVGDCALYEACLDMNFKFDQQFVAAADAPTCGGVPGFKAVFNQVQVLNRQAGVVCSGAGLAADDTLVVSQTSSNDIVTINLPTEAQKFAPPICMKGLDLGGFVSCGTPHLLTIETDGDLAFKDFLGVTCAISATP